MINDMASGNSFPLGATATGEGVNFSAYSKNASQVELLLFESADAAKPSRVISLDCRTHRTDIEVILDVVYDHTAEGGMEGPTFCFRGWENAAYYILEKDRAKYGNYTGTGNTTMSSRGHW